jgi:hypothetical protein
MIVDLITTQTRHAPFRRRHARILSWLGDQEGYEISIPTARQGLCYDATHGSYYSDRSWSSAILARTRVGVML